MLILTLCLNKDRVSIFLSKNIFGVKYSLTFADY